MSVNPPTAHSQSPLSKRRNVQLAVVAAVACTALGITPAMAAPTPTPTPSVASASVDAPTPSATDTPTPTPSASTATMQPRATAAATAPAPATGIEIFAAQNPWVGAPTGAEVGYGSGAYRTYQNAVVTWTPEGVYAIGGGIRSMWEGQGGAKALGLAVSGEISRGGGVYQKFERGLLTWHPTNGFWVVRDGIFNTYAANGGAQGPLGLPIGNEYSVGSGALQRFEGGYVTWHPTAGAHVVRDGMATTYTGEKGASGRLGFPTSNEFSAAGGAVQNFQAGALTWHPSLGAATIFGGIGNLWLNNGGADKIGYANGGEVSSNGGVYRSFERATITWHPSKGAYIVSGGILNVWNANGGVGGLGYPVSGEISANGGAYQNFEGGTITWHPQWGAYVVANGFGSYWANSGGVNSWLGWPTSGENCIQHSCTQRFTGGVLTWNGATGVKRGEVLDPRCTYGRVVCADKSTNQMYWVVNGQIQRTMDVRFGRAGHETSEGNFTIFRKEEMSWSIPFSAWMPWSSYFTAGGEAIHYSSGFDAEGHPSLGSHGCLNMASWDDAEWLYRQAGFGDRVVVYWS